MDLSQLSATGSVFQQQVYFKKHNMTLSKNAKLCNYGKMFKNPHICPHRTTVLLTNIPEH